MHVSYFRNRATVILPGGGVYPRREFVTHVTSKNLVAALLLRGA